MDTLIEQFNAEGVNRGERTRQWYSDRIKKYLQFLAEEQTTLEATTAATLKRFFADMRQHGFSWSTRNGTHTALSVFYEWLVLRDHIEANPFEAETIPRPKKPRRLKPELHLSSVQVVLDVLAQVDSKEAKRDAALILIMVDGGLRRMEAVGLNVCNVNLGTGKVSVLVAKNDDQRWTLVRPVTRQALKMWLSLHPTPAPREPIFISLKGQTSGQRLSERRVNGILTKWSNEAGLNVPLRPHDLRRLFVTTFADRGGGLSIIQSLVGHSNIETTEGYINTNEGEIILQHTKNAPGNFLDF